jgi:hypothetical protein
MSEHNQPQEDEPLALEQIKPSAVAEWRRRTGMSGKGRAWTDYSLLLNHSAEALRRAPYTREECETVDIVELVNTEFAYLSDVLALLFPDGVMARKLYEETEPQTD